MVDLPAAMVQALEPISAIRAAWLFGSQISGRARPDSDLDLADALGTLGERADVVELDERDSAVAFRAVRDGNLLFARTEVGRVRTVARVARRHDDEAPRRELFRRAALAAAARMGADRGDA